jgi:hypothetical protein
MRRLLFILVLLGSLPVWAGFDADPLYERVADTNGMEFLAVRPFYSKVVDPQHERWNKDYLWPLYTRKGFQDETYSRFLLFGWSQDFSETNNRHRVWVIPFYFKGESSAGEKYFALFPIGGSIHEFLGRDKVGFVLFPLYGRSHINDVHTTSILWPIYSKTEGPRDHRLRVWPFYGTSTRDDDFVKKFVLWPFYTSVQYTNERNPGGGFILLPIYGRVVTEKWENRWYLAPFFRHMTSEEQTIVHAPWPFIQLADGEMHKRVFWPLYGKKSLGTQTNQYWLWPFLWNNKTEYGCYNRHRRFIVPIFSYQADVVTQAENGHEVGDVTMRYWKLWPLMSWERRNEDSRFRMLDLWPLRHTPGIERNWAPYWSLYRRVRNNGEVGHHFLWGVYRHAKSLEKFEWSLLKGLAGYKKEGDQRCFQFLFMWFGDTEEE